MVVAVKPIPPLYTVYVLRSTVRRTSLYIGSTPHPPRRLRQHNGEAKGGAARTSRDALRPWEMAALVSGFPSMIAALKFEWALNNPHLSLHIPTTERLSKAVYLRRRSPSPSASPGKKKKWRRRTRKPRRPRPTVASVVSNVHLLLRVPSFARWPLSLHFFAADVHAAWERWCAEVGTGTGVGVGAGAKAVEAAGTKKSQAKQGKGKKRRDEEEDTDTEALQQPPPPRLPPLSDAITITTDFAPAADEANAHADNPPPPRGIHALPLDYAPLRAYVAKTQSLFASEREGDCVECGGALAPGGGLYAVCPNAGCEGVGHVACWAGHLLRGDDEQIIPVAGQCPRCEGRVRWGDMMRELSLRVRGQKVVAKLLKEPGRRGRKKVVEEEMEEEEEDGEEEEEDEEEVWR